MKERIVFMGTPVFACAILKCLKEADYDVVLVVSQPDKKVGRKQLIQETPVKALAQTYGIEVFQPERIKDTYEQILRYRPDLIVTCAYGQMIPEALLHAPRHGSINVHASLLPKLRGGAPIHKAIINGDSQSGISIMRMVKQMDAGAVMKQVAVAITQDDTMGTLSEKLAAAGGKLLLECLPLILRDEAVFIEQDESQATFAYNISKEEEKIDFTRPLQNVYDQIRGLIPSPIGYAFLNGKKIKFHAVRKKEQAHAHQNGELVGMMEGALAIACEGGYLLVEELQMEGKAKLDAKSFYNGAGRNLIGSCIV